MGKQPGRKNLNRNPLNAKSPRPRPLGSGQRFGGFFIFDDLAQQADQVAYTLELRTDRIYHLVQEGKFDRAIDISMDTSRRPCWRIPRESVFDYINNLDRKLGKNFFNRSKADTPTKGKSKLKNLLIEPPQLSDDGQILDKYFIFNDIVQRADQVAFTLNCSTEHIYHLIPAGEFDRAINISVNTTKRPCWRIPREDILDFINCRQEGAL